MKNSTDSSLFISYRRDDTKQVTERLHERLAAAFGSDAVFIDIDHIPAGTDFTKHIEKTLETCGVVLVMIGQQWLQLSDANGNRRLDAPDDYVRAEIEWAHRHGKPVIPVLIDGASMPNGADLPESIQFLAQRNAVEIRSGADLDFTTLRLIEQLQFGYGLNRKDRPFRWEIPLLIFSILTTFVGAAYSLSGMVLISMIAWDGPSYCEELIKWELIGPFLLGLGPLGIAVSNWICCMRNASSGPKAFVNNVFQPKRKAPRAMLGFALGIASLGWGIIAGIPAIVFAVLGAQQIRRAPQYFRGIVYYRLAILFAIVGSLVSAGFQYFVSYEQYHLFLQMDQAEEAIEKEQWEQADRLLTNIFEASFLHPRAYLLGGKYRFAEGSFPEALLLLEDFIAGLERKDPSLLTDHERAGLIESFRLSAEMLADIGETEQAKEYRQRADLLKQKQSSKRFGKLEDS